MTIGVLSLIYGHQWQIFNKMKLFEECDPRGWKPLPPVPPGGRADLWIFLADLNHPIERQSILCDFL